MKTTLSQLDDMTPQQERQFCYDLEKSLASDRGEAAKQHLAAGHPIYYGDESYPNVIIKEYPDHRKELVYFDDNDNEIVIRTL